eukprot:7540798-Prorocentrum_lima.AAC.1
MTSSLVGSEMCIRDRAMWGVKDAPRAFGMRPRRSLQEIGYQQGVTDRPVSYTHLTLPTICSV